MLPSRVIAGHTFGIVLVLVLLASFGAGLAVALAIDRTVLAAETRRRVAIALITLVALIPLAGAAALATSSRGFGGEVSHIWTSLTNTHEVVRDNPGRLVSLESSRARDWTQGWHVFTHAPVKGVGALGYATARLRYTQRWRAETSAAFLDAYRAAVADAPALQGTSTSQSLLEFFVLEKALYELAYELDNRPDWVAIPLSGIAAALGPESA